ncbi:MAG TPA: TIGR00282 family metallophosphoesterase [Deltaproteobacteria bacterium]|nr:TIGR00282 family metallophosphoesterase [Deltaproteobacteria bacterium]
MADKVGILFLGDVIGRPGRKALRSVLPALLDRYDPDVLVANGENAAGGFGITPQVAEELFGLGVHVITSGNHIWDKREVLDYIDGCERLIRPANYPEGTPGRGSALYRCRTGALVAVANLAGTVFMDPLECPFRVGKALVERLRRATPVVVVDCHCETTSEKGALGWHLDGLASAVVGTHTHVQTSDERILPGGTAYITDAGMTGSMDSVIGVKKEAALARFLTRMPSRFDPATKDLEVQGLWMEIDGGSGRALSVERVKEKA